MEFVRVYPALHVQSEMEMLPIAEVLSDEQYEQPVRPIHISAIHLQAVIVVLAEIECEFVGHSKHPIGSKYMSAIH